MPMTTTCLNLNADLGEGAGQDKALLALVNSANIACGGHTGDAASMRAAVRGALANGVDIGAHPSFPDREGFGRRRMAWQADEVRAFMAQQIEALMAIARAEGASLTHVKPHGALHNMACADLGLARVLVQAMREVSPHEPLIVLAPCLSPLAQAAEELGLPLVAEAYADRRYQADGQLAPRSEAGAVIHDSAQTLAHVRAMRQRGGLITTAGELLPCEIESICLHGDNAEALASAQALVADLSADGVQRVGLRHFVAAQTARLQTPAKGVSHAI